MSTLTQFSAKSGPTRELQSYTSSLTLTANSAGYNVLLNPSTNRSTVTLPNATTLTTGGNKYILENATNYEIAIRAADGQVLAGLGAQGKLTLNLANNSTSGGVWSGSNGYNLSDIVLDGTDIAPVTLSSIFTTESAISVCMVSNTVAVVCYSRNESSTGRFYARTATLNSNNSVSLGTEVLVYNTNYNYTPSDASLAKLDNNVAVMSMTSWENTYYYLKAARLAVSGSTITVSPIYSGGLTSSGGYNTAGVVALTANTFAVPYGVYNGSSYDYSVMLHTWNGSNITLANNNFIFNNGLFNIEQVSIPMTSNTFAVLGIRNMTNSYQVRDVWKYTVDGTGTSVSATEYIVSGESGLSLGLAGASYFGNNNLVVGFSDYVKTRLPYWFRYTLLDTTGATPVKNANWGYDTYTMIDDDLSGCIMAPVTANNCLMLYEDASSQYIQMARVMTDSNKIYFANTSTNLTFRSGMMTEGNRQLAVTPDTSTDYTKALYVYRDTNSYPTLKVINFKFPQITGALM